MESFFKRTHRWLKHHANVRAILIFILFVLCAFELESIWRGLEAAYTTTDPYITYHHGQIVHENPVVRTRDIQPWMTFQYVNFVFKLPPNYLADALVLTDPRYPKVQIGRYARTHALPLATFVQEVQTTVAGYTPQTF